MLSEGQPTNRETKTKSNPLALIHYKPDGDNLLTQSEEQLVLDVLEHIGDDIE